MSQTAQRFSKKEFITLTLLCLNPAPVVGGATSLASVTQQTTVRSSLFKVSPSHPQQDLWGGGPLHEKGLQVPPHAEPSRHEFRSGRSSGEESESGGGPSWSRMTAAGMRKMRRPPPHHCLIQIPETVRTGTNSRTNIPP